LGLAFFAHGLSGVGILTMDKENAKIIERLSRIEIKIDKSNK